MGVSNLATLLLAVTVVCWAARHQVSAKMHPDSVTTRELPSRLAAIGQVSPNIHLDSGTNWDLPSRLGAVGQDSKFWRSAAQQTVKEHLLTERVLGQAMNVIMFLGDGMSVPTLAATRLYVGQKRGQSGEEQVLSFEKFPFTGLSKTYCVDSQVADSACSATAYLCGVKANFATIGVSANVARRDCKAQLNVSNHVSSVLQWAQDAGKSTGIVTTARVTHASPAGTYAHVAFREWESDADMVADGADPQRCDDIAEQLVRSDPGRNFKVILGGGRSRFRPTTMVDEEGFPGVRQDGKDLVAEWQDDKKKRSATSQYVWNRNGLLSTSAASTDYLLGLFEPEHMAYNLEADNQTEPTLPEMTAVAISMLQKNPQGFFLFIEAGRIDHGHHENLAQKALDETEQLSEAVQLAARLTKSEDTLIVVTSDHAHVMAYNGYPGRGSPVLGVAGVSDVDKLPYTTLSYANGPGYKPPQQNNCSRYDVSSDNLNDKDYRFPALAPLTSETHGGEDVAVFARGPWAHLFTGSYEQNVIPHLMAFSSCVGGGITACNSVKLLAGDASYSWPKDGSLSTYQQGGSWPKQDSDSSPSSDRDISWPKDVSDSSYQQGGSWPKQDSLSSYHQGGSWPKYNSDSSSDHENSWYK